MKNWIIGFLVGVVVSGAALAGTKSTLKERVVKLEGAVTTLEMQVRMLRG